MCWKILEAICRRHRRRPAGAAALSLSLYFLPVTCGISCRNTTRRVILRSRSIPFPFLFYAVLYGKMYLAYILTLFLDTIPSRSLVIVVIIVIFQADPRDKRRAVSGGSKRLSLCVSAARRTHVDARGGSETEGRGAEGLSSSSSR